MDFETVFGRPLAARASAPGRVNLIGEHVDYNGGTVLPMAVSKSVQASLAPNNSSHHRVASAGYDGLVERSVGAPRADDWADYVIGALAEAEALGLVEGGFDVMIEADLPAGAGLSSSAALITAVLNAASQYKAVRLAPVDLAHVARRVENNYIGVPCGIMDQMAVGLCRPGDALALDTSSGTFELVKVPSSWAISIVHSGVTRKLNDGRYEMRFEECAEIKDRLGEQDICRVDIDTPEALSLPAALRSRLLHVTSEHRRVLDAVTAMRLGEIATFGDLMTASHKSYTGDFEASHPDIDALVASALSFGARGARLTGGGFGGCIVILSELASADAVLNRLLAAHPRARLVE